MALPEVTAKLTADVSDFIQAWNKAAAAATAAAAQIKAAMAAASGDIDSGKFGRAAEELNHVGEAAKKAGAGLGEFGNDAKKASGDTDKLGNAAKKAGESIGGNSGGLLNSMNRSGAASKLMAAGIAVIASVLPAVAAAALAAGAALQGLGVVAGVVIMGWRGIEQAGERLKASMGGLQKQLESIFRSELSGEFQKLGQAISSMDSPLKAIARSTSDVIKEFTGWIRSSKGMDEIKNLLGGVDNMVKQLAPGAKALGEAFTGFGAAAAPVLGKIGEAISSVFKELNKVIQKAKETGQLTKAFEAGAEAIKAFGVILAGVIEIFIEMAAQGGKPAAEALKKFGQALKDAAPLIGLVFKELATAINIIMTVVGWLAKLAKAMEPVYKAMGKGLDAVNDFVKGLDTSKGSIDKWKDDTNKAINQWVENWKKGVDKWKDDTNKNINKGLDDTKKKIDKWKDDTNKSIDKWVENWKKGVDKWKDTTNKDINKGLEDAKKNIDKWKDDTNKSINELVDEWLEAVGKWWDETSQDISDGIDKAVQFIATLPDKAMQALSDWVSDMKQIGKDAIDGIAEGIESAVGNLVGAATAAAQKALNAIKSTLGIASPSVVFRNEVGMMISQGIADGVIANAGAITDAMNRTGLNALAAGRGALGGAAMGRGGQQAMTLQVSGGADGAVGTMIARLAQQGKLKITANAVVGGRR